MNGYLNNMTPDSLSGIIFALEGIEESVVVLNGPTGCKFYHAATSDNQSIRQFEFDPLNYPEKWYFGQPRVPCTYLDSGDYIYGSEEKLTETLNFIRDNVAFELLCVVNSPGAALIGDNLDSIVGQIIREKPVVIIETPGFSSDICSGYESAGIELFKQLPVNTAAKAEPLTVNILGLSIYHKYHTGDIAELKRLLELCGIRVNGVLCADCDVEGIRNISRAALNIVVHPEYGLKTAQYLHKRFNTPFFVCDGPPVGFAATEKLMNGVCAQLGADNARFITECEKARARAYSHISRINSLTGLPKGVSFSVEGTYSEIYAYADFLVNYFGMIPESVNVLNGQCDCFKKRLADLLDSVCLPEVLNRDILQATGELVFAGGNTIARLKLEKRDFAGIEISLPSLGYVDVIAKTHIGIQGALMLTEQIINGMIF